MRPDKIERFFRATLRLSHLRTLAALSRLGQVRKVAESFHVTQAAVSKQSHWLGHDRQLRPGARRHRAWSSAC